MVASQREIRATGVVLLFPTIRSTAGSANGLNKGSDAARPPREIIALHMLPFGDVARFAAAHASASLEPLKLQPVVDSPTQKFPNLA
jgi:hypothetical protein